MNLKRSFFLLRRARPDLTLLLDVDIEWVKSKLDASEWNRLDAYDLEFHGGRQGYLRWPRRSRSVG